MTPAMVANPGIKVLEKIMQLDLGSCEIQVCMAGMRQELDTPDFQRVTISKEVAVEFQKIVEKILTKRKKELEKGDLVLHPYDPGTKPDLHEVEILQISEHEAINAQISGLSDIMGLEAFLAEDEFLSSLRFYVIALFPRSGNPVYCFRTYSQKRELTRTTFLAVVLKQGHYDQFTDRLFLFDQHIDCICRGNDLFIFKKDNFQKIFQFYKLLLKTAKDTLQIIKTKIPIDNFEDFEHACEGHLQKVAKLKNIASKPYLKNVNMKDLKKVIKRYKLPIVTVGRGNNEKIHFDKSDRWAILRLLDDDYLESVLTGNSYEANSKRKL